MAKEKISNIQQVLTEESSSCLTSDRNQAEYHKMNSTRSDEANSTSTVQKMSNIKKPIKKAINNHVLTSKGSSLDKVLTKESDISFTTSRKS